MTALIRLTSTAGKMTEWACRRKVNRRRNSKNANKINNLRALEEQTQLRKIKQT